MAGFLSCRVLIVPLLNAASAGESAVCQVEVALVATLLVSVLSGVFLLGLMRLKLPFSSRITPMSGPMVVLFLIRSRVFLPLGLVFCTSGW